MNPAGTVRFASLGAKRTRWNFFAWLQASCKRIQAPLAWSVLTDHSRLAKSKVFEAKVTLASLQAKPPHQKKLPLISLRFQTSENTQKTFSTPRCFKPSEMNIPQGSLSLLVKWENPRKKFLLAWIPAKRNEHSSRFSFITLIKRYKCMISISAPLARKKMYTNALVADGRRSAADIRELVTKKYFKTHNVRRGWREYMYTFTTGAYRLQSALISDIMKYF